MFTLSSKFRNYITVILAVIFASGSVALADGIPPVMEVKADLHGSKKGDVFIADGIINWAYPMNEDNVVGFNVYLAEGKTDNFNDFQILQYVKKENSARGYFHLQVKGLESNQNIWSFTVTAVDGNNNESDVVNYFHAIIRTSNSNVHKIFITSKPDLNAKIGEVYTYTPEVETDVEDAEIVYNLRFAPDNVDFDKETGKISWTPTKAGTYNFNLEVKAVIGDKIIAATNQPWHVLVSNCTDLAVIKGKVEDENGNSIKMGVVTIFRYDEINSRMHKSFAYNAKFDNGEFIIPHLDKGEYYMLVEAFGMNNITSYYPVWYKNAFKFEDAETLNVDCGDEIEVSFVMKEVPRPTLYKVSGKVIDAETMEPVKNGLVEFRGMESSSNKMVSHAFRTNMNGVYEGKLPDSFIYTAVATGVYFTDANSRPQAYFPQFFELADNPTDAKSIMLNGDKSDIDFYLIRVPNYENNIFGTVVDADDEVLSGIEVTAFLVDSKSQNDRYLYTGKSSKTDEFGAYKIENLLPGDYVILARPHNRTLSPGFYIEDDFATLSWEDATRVKVGEEGSHGSYKIQLALIEKNGGKGLVRGNVSRNKKGAVNIGEEVQSVNGILGASVYLVNSKGNVTQYLDTDEFGSFELANIAAGKYTLVIDKIGFNSVKTDITVGEESVIEKDFEMSPRVVSSVNDSFDFVFEIYPNPASEIINISIPSEINAPQIKLLNYTGAEILNIEKLSGNMETIKINSIPAGLYFIEVRSEKSISVKPVVIVK